ncbi:MAG TPA: phosphate signaling complex protein PhoU [Isosphaeraceae bacterium]|nr:phosphate signaling complex protein PhoU [Isosphaeraceae bacterium]
MPHEHGAVDSDWDVERVTLGRNFVRDMEGLWSRLLRLAAVVEAAVAQSIRALCDGRVDLAEELKRQKWAVDGWEVQIERECVRMLALHQPVASDLRRVAVVLKINADLVRLSDLALHIAKRIKKLARDSEAAPIPQGLESLALESLTQLHDSLDALTQSDVSLAQAVIAADQQVDCEYRAVQKVLKEGIVRDPDRIDTWLRLVNTARNLERIADHASKIAEAVIYLKHGAILRHRAVLTSSVSSSD